MRFKILKKFLFGFLESGPKPYFEAAATCELDSVAIVRQVAQVRRCLDVVSNNPGSLFTLHVFSEQASSSAVVTRPEQASAWKMETPQHRHAL